MVSQPDGPFVNLARLNVDKYAADPQVNRALFEYVFYHEGDMKVAHHVSRPCVSHIYPEWWYSHSSNYSLARLSMVLLSRVAWEIGWGGLSSWPAKHAIINFPLPQQFPCCYHSSILHLEYNNDPVEFAWVLWQFQIAAIATKSAGYSDWYWKNQLGKCYYRLGMFSDALKQLHSSLNNQKMVETYAYLAKVICLLEILANIIKLWLCVS